MVKDLSHVGRVLFLAFTFSSDDLAGAGSWVRGGPTGRTEVLRAIFQGNLEGLKRCRRLAKRRRAGG
ncbi:MAG TPA: hypothetical protein VNI57_09500 [Candidatus Saccharimonadales bacterium]|nr:hypothetical protein [Candidatus Saccharimonadales bacterium]